MLFRHASRVQWVALAIALGPGAAIGCRDSQGPRETSGSSLPTLIVSDPVAGAAVSGAVAVLGTVYVSLPPGSVPEADQVVIGVRATGLEVTVAAVAGGFDPIPVAAEAGNTLDVRVYVNGSSDVRSYTTVVPVTSTPVIVRTDPPSGRPDVPLNAVIRVVFSEPIAVGTVTAQSVQLLQGTTPVAGTLASADAAHLIVTFTPAAPLVSGTAYTLTITQGIKDQSGDPLAAPVSVGFQTTPPDLALAGTYRRLVPHTQAGQQSRLVINPDGSFALEYATLSNTWTYSGRYVRSSLVSFSFDNGNLPGAWTATGTSEMGSTYLTMHFNNVLGLPEIEDGVYTRNVEYRVADAVAAGTYERVTPHSQPGQHSRFVVGSDGLFRLELESPAGNIYYAGLYWRFGWEFTLQVYQLGGATGTVVGDSLYVVYDDSLRAQGFEDGVYHRAPDPVSAPGGPSPGTIAFVRIGEIAGDLYTTGRIYKVNSDGTGLVQLSDGPDDMEPAWSPDGRRIAFHRSSLGIYIMDADGSNLAFRRNGGWPSWSPDGQWLAFVAANVDSLAPGYGATDVYLMKVDDDGTSPINLTNTPEGESSPAWSPDGSRIAFMRNGDLYTMTPSGTQQTQVTHLPHYVSDPAWSPDGKRLAVHRCTVYDSTDTCYAAVSVINADGSSLVQLTMSAGTLGTPTWSPDGQTIAFGGLFGSIDWISPDGKRWGVILGNENGHNHSPAWAP